MINQLSVRPCRNGLVINKDCLFLFIFFLFLHCKSRPIKYSKVLVQVNRRINHESFCASSEVQSIAKLFQSQDIKFTLLGYIAFVSILEFKKTVFNWKPCLMHL